ncbi:Cytochrome c [Polystyrenella longa]|uniref:Cytochrome c n=1 Tax=Polystyrenella longa TaxID=2528007 RepID=A0A518CSF8_9PLAN|nr:c-type cytochrome [Polystyrenella longa]QDU82150.1 Cytochrome c [Polystyrenella longa]
MQRSRPSGLLALVCSFLIPIVSVAAAEVVSPVIPGYERFQNEETRQPEQGGRILLGELNCLSCHKAQQEGLSSFSKQAPILSEVGDRVRAEYLREYLKDPHQSKPGTTMPDVLSDDETDLVEPLVHFLASTGQGPRPGFPSPAMAERGKKLFNEVGCMACHQSPEEDAKELPHAVPFGKIEDKYTISSLSRFLQDPLHVRPSGRMPALNLPEAEADQIASYLLRNVDGIPNLRFAYYEGSWSNLPNFDELEPVEKGVAAEIDFKLSRRKDDFGFRFESNFQIKKEGEYTFFLGSDDGSRLIINGEELIDYDGIHGHGTRSEKLKLASGWHTFQVDYFEKAGFESLDVELEGPELSRRPLASISSIDPDAQQKQQGFEVDAELAAQGKVIFAEQGCADCHELKTDSEFVFSKLISRPFESLGTGRGCLAENPEQTVPNFHLSEQQRTELNEQIEIIGNQPIKALTGESLIVAKMTQFNCYACHERNQIGGPEGERDAFFVSTIPEMGDEGRRPPGLTGVGDKLNTEWLKHVLDSGANERSYMATRMPRFGMSNVGMIVDPLVELDRKTEFEEVETQIADYRLQGEGRHIVGEKGMACIKCHTFGEQRATGIQSVDLLRIPQRIRKDWFHRYLINPQKYRKGTRMPAYFFGGQSMLADRLDGSVPLQVEAMWDYLSLGDEAPIPDGIGTSLIELIADGKPIVYRNFIEGVSPRGIAVGYPENANLAFDADEVDAALIWHGRFIDASKHWTGRGQGFQPPLGDHVLSLVRGIPFAQLEKADTPWPTISARDAGYRFRGYQFDQKSQPIFLYSTDQFQVQDHFRPVSGESDPHFERSLTVTFKKPLERFWFRAALDADIKDLGGNEYQLSNGLKLKLHLPSSSIPRLRKVEDQQELLVPLLIEGEMARLQIDYIW